jgi:UTP:GlnB (protein PII) uridylyltransferase
MEKIESRTREIVEELRADIDFELDDVITNIVSSLPEEYFKRLSRNDQLSQLKALLAMAVCQLDQEIMTRSEDGRHVGVVSRQNYPGLLANILKRLPTDHPLIGAKVFTSTDHEFIIDLFEFKIDTVGDFKKTNGHEVEGTIEAVATATGKSIDVIREFVSHYQPDSPILNSPENVAEHISITDQVESTGGMAVRWKPFENQQIQITISAADLDTREVFQQTAKFLADHFLDIEQAILHDVPITENSRIAIASFVVTRSATGAHPVEFAADELKRFLEQASQAN